MISYRNTGIVTKTFYGITFNPGESKNVPGYINDPCFVITSIESADHSNKEDKTDKPNKHDKESKQKTNSVDITNTEI